MRSPCSDSTATAMLAGALGTVSLLPATLGAQPQHQAITGLAAPARRGARPAFAVTTVASPAPDAINMHIIETSHGLVLFDALRRRDQVDAIERAIRRARPWSRSR